MTKVPWDSTHASNLKNFLESESGQYFWRMLEETRPPLLEARSGLIPSLNRSFEVKGYEFCLETIKFFFDPQFLDQLNNTQTSPAENYPNLDDDSKWDLSGGDSTS